jgi:hypothetical protein
MQSAHTLAGMVDELIAEGIQFHAVEARSSVRDRLRREGVDGKLGGVNRFATVADVTDHFLGESAPSAPAAIKSSPGFS